MTEDQFADALIAATCDAEREAIIRAALAAHQADRVDFAQQVKSYHFDRYLNADLDKAFSIADGIEQLGHAAHDEVIIALGLLARGDAARQGGHALTAMDLHERAGARFLRAGDRVGWARARGGWLVAATHAGRVTEADLAEMTTVCDILADAGQTFRLAVLEQNRGLAYQSIGLLQQAMLAFTHGIALLTEQDSVLRAMLLGNTANIHLWQGDLKQALLLKSSARNSLISTGSSGPAAIEEIGLAHLERLRWHNREAIRYIDSALALLKQAKLPLSQASALAYRADILLSLNRHEEAEVDITQAIALLQNLQVPVDLAQILRRWAQVLAHAGRDQEAVAALLEGERIVTQAGYLQEVILIGLDRVALLMKQGKVTEAREAALALLHAPVIRGTETYRGMALLWATEATLALDKIAWAQAMARAVIKRGAQLEAPELQYRGYLVLARAARRVGQLDEACAYYDRAIGYIQALVSELVLDQGAQFLEDKDTVYLEALDVALTAGDAARALAYLERGRLRATWTLAPATGDEAGAQLADLRRRHRYISASLLTLPADSPTASGAREELKRLARQIRDILENQAQRAGGADHVVDLRLPDARRVPLTTLAYALLADDLVIFVIRDGLVTAVRVAEGARQVRKSARALRLAIDTLTERLATAPAARVADEVAQWAGALRMTLAKLWNILIQPVAHLLPPFDAPLAIIPHGLLHALPLAALHDGQHYLAERWLVQFVPSCQAFTAVPAEAAASRPLLALGYAQDDDLRYTPADARHVGTLMAGEVWTDEAATGERLVREVAGRQYLHIAAHGALRLDVPNSSFVQLADGPFHPTDVLEMDLRGCRLVTLSACETGLGRLSGGDEQIGLVRAFGIAGAEAVLATLWRVDDAATFAFMDQVYRHIATGSTPAEAVRAAQLAFIRTPDPAYRAHPYFWAGFHLTSQVVRPVAVPASARTGAIPSPPSL